jgi:hypothetical protein
VVNIVTRSGTNHFHGSAFEFLRKDAMDARNYFNRAPATKSPFHNNNFGVSIGGPIVKNRTFFFGAYEGQRERVGSDFAFQLPGNNPALPAARMSPPKLAEDASQNALYAVLSTASVCDVRADSNHEAA